MINRQDSGKCRVDLLALMSGDPPRYGGNKRHFAVEREGLPFGSIHCEDYAANTEWTVWIVGRETATGFNSFDAAASYAERVADAYKGAN